uniref:Uncharacterized protein n=1 Tax=Rhizophora mucronata TaxID=61149 RepID=A0A2P2P539_RHIMU
MRTILCFLCLCMILLHSRPSSKGQRTINCRELVSGEPGVGLAGIGGH